MHSRVLKYRNLDSLKLYKSKMVNLCQSTDILHKIHNLKPKYSL